MKTAGKVKRLLLYGDVLHSVKFGEGACACPKCEYHRGLAAKLAEHLKHCALLPEEATHAWFTDYKVSFGAGNSVIVEDAEVVFDEVVEDDNG